MIPFVYESRIETDDVAGKKLSVRPRYPVNDLLVYRYAYARRITVIIEEVRNASALSYELFPVSVNIKS